MREVIVLMAYRVLPDVSTAKIQIRTHANTSQAMKTK
jgi:hypothetical protein